ncbi:hypothetical protein B0H14DRAFT_229705 [Mycena olivaceomarginata]|nr:hypothetical protein B0H14DRAFT_229705 [Mycena olivaceomarginata]
MAVSLIATNLATLAIGSLFYGSYLVLFSISLYLLLRRYDATHTSHNSRQHNSVFKSTVFVSAISLFLVVTAHWTTIVYRSFIAFVALQQGADAEKFFNDHTQLTEIIQNSHMSLSILIGDSLCADIQPRHCLTTRTRHHFRPKTDMEEWHIWYSTLQAQTWHLVVWPTRQSQIISRKAAQ